MDDLVDDRPSKRQRTTGDPDTAYKPSQDDDDDDDDDIILIETSSALSTASSTSSSLTTCPICSSGIHPDTLTSHVNACLDKQEHPARVPPAPPAVAQPVLPSSSSTSSSKHTHPTLRGTIPQAKLPRINYHLHRDAHLRALLKDHKLPTTGSRTQLVARHRALVQLWNASLDAREDRRPTVVEIRDRVLREERAKEVAAATAGPVKDVREEAAGQVGVVDALVKAAAASIGRAVPAAPRDVMEGEGDVETGSGSAKPDT